MKTHLLALDQGTSSSRSIVFDAGGRIVAMAQREFRQIYPQPGWVEHDPVEIWESQLATAREALAKAGLSSGADIKAQVRAIGITNQRETTLVWNRRTGQPIYNAIVWQDRRAEPLCAQLRAQGLSDQVRASTGLVIDAPAPGETSLLQRVQEVQQANLSLLQETSELRDIFRQAPGFMAVLTGSDLTFTLANDAYQQLIGHREVMGRPIDQALPEVRGQGFVNLLENVMASREPFIGRSASVVLQRTPEGPPEERFVDFIYQPILGPDGEAAGVFVEGSDVTDRVRAEQQQKLLLDELNHRVKNTLATVQSIAAQTLRTSPDPATFNQAFESRLLALSSTHDLLTASSWRGADLRDILPDVGDQRLAVDQRLVEIQELVEVAPIGLKNLIGSPLIPERDPRLAESLHFHNV